ncbi:MAG TPA: hypothetical protein VFZ44_09070 [Pyrinomonadaceae bacterium]
MLKARVTTVLLLLVLAAAQTAAARQADAPRPYRLSLPEKDWALDVTIPPDAARPAGAKPPKRHPYLVPTRPEYLSDDGREYLLMLSRTLDPKRTSSSGMLLIRLRPAETAGTAAELRAHALKTLSRNGLVGDGVKTWEHAGIPVAVYKPELRLGGPLGSEALSPAGARVAEAYFVRDDVLATLTLTTREFGEREEKFFRTVLDSVKFADTSAPSSSFDFYHKGHALYLRKDYRRASEALAAALELEKRQRRLDAATWRELVTNLVNSYAASRDYGRVKETLDFAVAEDPASPSFHVALARYHAMLGDMDNTIAHIEKAFLNRENDPDGEPLPDPARDPAFEKFREDERFRKALKELKK